MKYYVFDDRVIISGFHWFNSRANLSEDYFTDRQDRYFVIKNCWELAEYLESITSLILDHSFCLNETGLIERKIPWRQSMEVLKHHFSMFLYKNRIRDKEQKILLLAEEESQRKIRLLEGSLNSKTTEIDFHKSYDIELARNLKERKENARETFEISYKKGLKWELL